MILSRLPGSRSGTALSSLTLSRNRWILRAQYRTGRGEPGDPTGTGERCGLVDTGDGLRCGDRGLSLSSSSMVLSSSLSLLPYGSSKPKPKSPTSDPSSLAALSSFIVHASTAYTENDGAQRVRADERRVNGHGLSLSTVLIYRRRQNVR